MYTIFWSYKGYAGDKFYGDLKKLIAEKYAPNSKSTKFRLYRWLDQKGYGPGYFNNSGVYYAFQKSTFKSEADRDAALALMNVSYNSFTIYVYPTEEIFDEAKAEMKINEKQMRKLHPY